ncbi:MAG: iron chelate uptake ABC transporter family permease subunit [Chloroflexi bacterium]|nr:iron chelate uptake ABC transporter family permease subunit [Chloroflexota bacterium]
MRSETGSRLRSALTMDRRRASVTARLVVGGVALGTLFVVAAGVALSMGPVKIPLDHVAGILFAQIGIDQTSFSRTEELVVLQLRLPRIVVSGLVGMALAVSGATMQALFRNPMAEPGIIGVSAGGAAGGVLAIAFGLNGAVGFALPFFSFLGAMGATLFVYGIASIGGRVSMATLLLAGIAVSAFLSAVVSAIITFIPDNGALRGILFWLAGGLDSRSWDHVRVAAPFILFGTGVVSLYSRDLNLLTLGDDDARSLGVRVNRVRPILIVASALVTGVAVAVSGIIGFVGLVVPHMLRIVVGPDNRLLIPLSAIGGAVFLLLADTVARTVVQPAELRVGIVTAFVGAPFFLFLLVRNRRRIASF